MNTLMDHFPLLSMFAEPHKPTVVLFLCSLCFCCWCSCAGAIALAEVLAENKHITHLDLKENDIRVAGLMGLQLAHRMNHTLVSMETPKGYRVEPVSRERKTLAEWVIHQLTHCTGK